MPAARAALAQFEGRLQEAILYDASLCLSELVTNAVQHPAEEAGSELGLELSLSDDTLRVEVVDPGGNFRPGPPTEGDERGWGLFIVDQLSTRWGTQAGESRTVMWFEMERGEERARADEPRRIESEEDGEPAREGLRTMLGRPPEPILV